MRTYSIRRAIAMIGGIACIAAETLLNITHVYTPAQAWWLQPLVYAIAVAGVAQAIAAIILPAAASAKRWINAAIVTVGLIAAITFSFTTSYLRIAETAQDRRLERDGRVNQGGRALAGKVAAIEENERKECTTVGPECRKIRKDLVEARTALAGTGGTVETNVLGAYAIVPELALPLMLLLLGLSLIAYAEAPAPEETRQTSYPADEDLPDPGIFAPLPEANADERAAKVSSFAAEYRSRHGREPSVRTIAKATKIPPTSVHRAQDRAKRRASA